MEAHQSSGVPDLKLICPLSRHGCRMPRNNRHRKKLRFFCDDNAGTGTSSMLKHDSPRDSNHGAQHITYQHIMLSPLLPKLEGRKHNKLIIKRLSSTPKTIRAQKSSTGCEKQITSGYIRLDSPRSKYI